MDQNFDSGPRFWAMAQRARNGPKFENRTHPSVLELGLCKFQNVLGKPCSKTLLDQNFDLWPHLGSMGPPNGQKQSFLFRAVETSNFQDVPLFALENYQ